MEQIGLWAGFILTLFVFSYILGDNILYRLAIYIFVGLAAGYVAIITWETVLLPWINGAVLRPDADLTTRITGLVPLLLGLLLLLKASPRLGRVANLALAFLIGVGAAVALVGAISGTLVPLSLATGAEVNANPVNGVLLVVGVVCTLVYFNYLARRLPGGGTRPYIALRILGWVGQTVVIITLGALYAAAILTSLTIFSERVSFLVTRISGG
jgi:hypothetical protein